MRRAVLAVGVCAGLLAAPGAATGATLEISEDGRELRYVASGSERTSIFIVQYRGEIGFAHGRRGEVTAGRGCARMSESEIECDAPRLTSAVIELGDRPNRVDVGLLAVPAAVRGGSAADELYGGGGDDLLDGASGNDEISGGPGRDRLVGGLGDDDLDGIEKVGLDRFGPRQRDQLDCGEGHDLVESHGRDAIGTDCERLTWFGSNRGNRQQGLAGADRLYGGNGDDVIAGLEGDDGIFGGRGDDILDGDDGNDTLRGVWGDDRVRGGPGRDALGGNEGADTLIGGPDQDQLFGGTGADRVLAAGDGSADHVVCGRGRDAVGADPTDVVSRDCERVIRRR